MQKSIPHYLKYSFRLLFSKQFSNIVGSSLLVAFCVSIISSSGFLLFGYYFHGFALESPFSEALWIYGFMGFSLFLLFLSLILLLMRGWFAIIIPIRSIDDSKHIDIRGDWKLFRSYIGHYFSYVLWYSISLTGVIFLSLLLTLILSVGDMRLGGLWFICSIVFIFYLLTRFVLTWYHMLSEGSGRLKMFQSGYKMTEGKVWKIFRKVFGFSLIIWIGSALVEGILFQTLSVIGFGDFADNIARIIDAQKTNISSLVESLGTLFSENIFTLLLSVIFFSFFYSLSTVLSQAMFHIFYVRYYLDMREEHEIEHSFIMPILRKSEHHHSH